MSTKQERIDEIVDTVQKAEVVGREYLQTTGLQDDWREGLLTYLSQGELTNPEGFNLKANRLMSDLMTLVPRFLKYLVSTEPFFPLGAKNQRDPRARIAARNWEDVLNEFMRSAEIYTQMNDVMTALVLYGSAGLENRWDVDVVSTMEMKPIIDKSIGQIVGYEKKPSDVVKREFRAIPRFPWEMLFHPHGNTLKSKQWAIVKDLVDVEEVRRLIDLGSFALPNGFDDEDLDKPPHQTGRDYDPQIQWTRDRSVYSRGACKNLGVLARYYENPTRKYPGGRWSYIWNYTVPLMKDGFTENQLSYVSKNTKPFTFFRDCSPPRPDRFYGNGIYRVLKDLIRHRDDLLSVALDRVYSATYGWWLYDSNAIEPEHMRAATYGARVPMKSTYSKSPQEAMYHVPGSDPPDSIFSMQGFIDTLSDDRVGTHYPLTGEPAPRKEAATTSSILANAGDVRMESQIRLVELSSMSDEGELASCMIANNATVKQIIDIIGIERYQQAPVDSLHSIDGGYLWRFKGSSQVVQNTQEREALKDSWSMVGGDPVTQRGDRSIVVRKILELGGGGLTDDEIEKVAPMPSEPPTIPVEVQQQMQQQQMMQQQAMAAQQGPPPDRIQTQEQQYGIVGAQRPGATSEQASKALARIMSG